MFAGRRQPGGTRTPSPGRGGCGAPGAPGPGPGCAAAPRGRFVRGKPAGVTSKRDTARPQTAPPGGEIGWKPPPSPPPAAAATPPLPPAEFRGRPKFPGKREKSPERPWRGRFSPQLSLPTPPHLFPPLLPLFPAPSVVHARPTGTGTRRAAEPGGGGGRSRQDPRAAPDPKHLLARICRENENFHAGRAFKKLYYIPPKGKGREMKSGGVGKGPDLAAKTVLKLKRKTNKKHPVRAQISMNGRGGPGF